MKRKSYLIMILVLSLVFALSACSKKEGTSSNAGSAAPSKPLSGQLSFGAGPMGGAYYPFGQTIANLVTKHSGGLVMTPEVTGGAIENARLVIKKDVEISITNENHAYAAVNGLAPFEEKNNITVIGRMYPSVLHIMVPADSKINSIADLKGKRVAVGSAGGGTIFPFEAAFATYGMTMKDIVPSYISYNDGFLQLADGNVDAALSLSGYPAAAVMEYTATKSIKFVNIDDSKFDSIIKTNPYFSRVVVPAATYNMPADGVAIGISNVLIVHSDADNDIVYAITKSIFDNLPEFVSANANAKDVSIATAKKASIATHPGAQKYFDEH